MSGIGKATALSGGMLKIKPGTGLVTCKKTYPKVCGEPSTYNDAQISGYVSVDKAGENSLICFNQTFSTAHPLKPGKEFALQINPNGSIGVKNVGSSPQTQRTVCTDLSYFTTKDSRNNKLKLSLDGFTPTRGSAELVSISAYVIN